MASVLQEQGMREQAQLRDLMSGGGRLSFPEPLESAFTAQHDLDTRLLLRRGAMALMLFAAMIGVAQGFVLWRLSPPLDLVHDLVVWTLGFWIIMAALGAVLLCAVIEAWAPYFVPVRALASFVGVLTILLSTWSIDNRYFANLAGYLVTMIVLVVYGFSRQRLLPAFFLVQSAALVALGIGLLLGRLPGWIQLGQSFGMASLFGAVLGALLEYRDRQIFLQSRLLTIEAEQLSRMAMDLDGRARVDRLTGLLNEHYFTELLAREWERARREQEPLSLLLIDPRHFQRFNEFYGYAAGDCCLAALARVLEAVMKRHIDLAARLHNAELLLLLPNTPAAGARKVQERIEDAVHDLAIEHQAEADGLLHVDIGITSMVPHSQQSYEDFLQSVRETMCLVKSSSSDTSIVW